VPFTLYAVDGERMPLGYAYGAGGILLTASVFNLLYEPGTDDMARVARKWNEAHPEQPLSVGEPPR
jgi:alpha-D-ribose 1-methylphosphonate 5-phosphate C-P lyase